MDRDAAVNVARWEASTVRAKLVTRHKKERTDIKDKFKESVRATDRVVACTAIFINQFHDRKLFAPTASDALVNSGIAPGSLDHSYQEERTRDCFVPLPSIDRTIRKKEHLTGGPVHSSGSEIRGTRLAEAVVQSDVAPLFEMAPREAL